MLAIGYLIADYEQAGATITSTPPSPVDLIVVKELQD